MDRSVEEAVASVTRALDCAGRGLSDDEYLEMLEEVEQEATSRREAKIDEMDVG